MVSIPLSTFTGAKDPTPSLAGERSALFQATPTTGQVTSAFIEEIFQGEGSLSQDILAGNIQRQTQRGKEPLTEDEWKESEFFRSGLTYFDGMTAPAARTLAEIEDDRENRALIISKSEGLQKGLGFVGAFGLGLFEPKNFASGVVASLFTGGVGQTIPTFGKIVNMSSKVGKYKGLAAKGAVEGGLAAALVEPSNIESSKIVQGDYTLADSLLNFALSSVLGAGLNVAPAKIRDVRKARKEMALQEADTAHAQLVQGKAVDVDAVKEVTNSQLASKARQKLPSLKTKLNDIQELRKINPISSRKNFAKTFQNTQVSGEDGSPLIVYHNSQQAGVVEEVIIAGQDVVVSSIDPVRVVDQTTTPVYKNIENPLRVPDDTATAPENIKLAKKNNHDGVIDEAGNFVAFKKNKVKPVYDRSRTIADSPKTQSFDDLDRTQVEIGNSNKDIRTTVDNQKITELQKLVAQPESTAYSQSDVDSAQAVLDDSTLDDQIALERSLQMMEEDIARMREEGIITDEEVSLIANLDEIDAQIKLEEDALLGAQICMVRG